MSNKRALGRGLEQLFTTEAINIDQVKSISELEKDISRDEVIQVQIDKLRPNPYQPRKHFDQTALEELAQSIKEHGVFQPIIVKESIKGYEIIAGERRFRASQMAGLETIPAVIRNFTDQQMMEIALLENLQREDLSAIEEAQAYKALIEKLNLTQEELSKKVGKSRSHITNILGLLNLPKVVQDLVLTQELSMGHARVLSKFDDQDKIKELAEKIITEGLSVRQTEELSRNEKNNDPKKVKKIKTVNYEYKYIEAKLRDKLGTKVKLDEKKMVINFSSVDELNRILDLIGVIED